jgi:L-ascorbate metabolism protein UlaG (beta-lactamase superfamily)
MLPEQGAQAYKDLRAKKYFPVHWGMFELSFHSWFDPIEQLYILSKSENIDLLAPKIGQIVYPSQEQDITTWWK